jgi:ZIP family zinc transporter
MNAMWLSLATLLSTSAGGLCALHFRRRLQPLLGFSAGVVLGVVAFDLLPESLAQSRRVHGSALAAVLALVAGFLLLHGLKRYVFARHAHAATDSSHTLAHTAGLPQALLLVVHSAIDGVGMGLAFQVSPAVGLTVALAVITHDFCDGLNTVGVMLMHGRAVRSALGVLVLDALAPVAGAASTMVFEVPLAVQVQLLGLLAGLLLHLGAMDILPRARDRAAPRAPLRLCGLTLLGLAAVYGLTRVATT